MKRIHRQARDGRRILSGIVLLAVVPLIMAGCSGNATEKPSAGAKPKSTALPVRIAAATVKDMPVELPAVGAVEAFATVAVKAQVEGQLTAVHLREGQCVNAGDLLFTIDPRPFEAHLKRAQANLDRDTIQLENARTLLARNASVVAKGYVSQEQYDQAAANAAALAATVKADEAAVEDARIQLAYCAIHAPITGCVGRVFVDRGNVVKANDADHPLVVIRQVRPIQVGFSVPERHLPQIRTHAARTRLAVLATPAGHGKPPVAGELTFVDNSVDTASGTILLKATFDNADGALWPGQFVSVVLRLTTQPRALVVPAQAVQNGQSGRYVFVVRDDGTVDHRAVTVERSVRGEAVIGQGLADGEKVVTDGQLRLFPGAAVREVTDGAEAGEAPRS